MNAQAISNRAMNYENAQRRFKIAKMEMKVEDDHLYVQILSPLLSGNNHSLSIQENRLRLKITDIPEAGNPIPLPLECDLFLPDYGYKFVKEEKATEGTITMRLTKKFSEKSERFLFDQSIA